MGQPQAINTLTVMKRYSLAQLYRLKRGNGYPDSSVCEKLKSLGIFHARSKKKRRPKQIPTIVTTKRRPKPLVPKPYKHFEVPRVWYNLPAVLLSNVTSLPNKLKEVTVTSESISCGLVAITEASQLSSEVTTCLTWLWLRVAVFCHNTSVPQNCQLTSLMGWQPCGQSNTYHSPPPGCVDYLLCVVLSTSQSC